MTASSLSHLHCNQYKVKSPYFLNLQATARKWQAARTLFYFVKKMDNDEEPSFSEYMGAAWDAALDAPQPHVIECTTDFPYRPPQYGQEFHGSLSRIDADRLLRLQEHDACYLVRSRTGEVCTLSIRLDPDTEHYPLLYENGKYSVGVESFNTIHDLVRHVILKLCLYRREGYDPGLTPTARSSAGSVTAINSSRRPLSSMSDYGSMSPTSITNDNAGSSTSTGVRHFTSTTSNAGSSTSARTRSVTSTNALGPGREVNEYEKAHTFKEKRFSKFHQCRFCQDSTFPIKQGFKCIDCGMQAHKRCGRTSPNDCIPERTRVKKVFGTDLTTLVKAYGGPVPFVVEICVQEIQKRGLDAVWIYRRCAVKTHMGILIQEFDENKETTDVSEDRYPSIHTVAATLKEYFRQLPLALINGEYYDRLIEIVENDGHDHLEPESIGEIREVMLALPPAHFHTLKYFCQHLHLVAAHETTNEMTTEFLAISVGQSVIKSDDVNTVLTMKNKNEEQTLMKAMIVNHIELFRE